MVLRSRFQLSAVVIREEREALTRVSNVRGACAVLMTLGAAVLLMALPAWHPSPWLIGPVVVLLGGRQMAMGKLFHDAAHGTLFSSARLNDFVGDWLLARPLWGNFAAYRTSHLMHHAALSTTADPDRRLVEVLPMPPRVLAGRFARDLLGITALQRVATMLLEELRFVRFSTVGDLEPVSQAGRSSWCVVKEGARNLARVGLVQLGLFAACWASGHPALFGLWWLSWATTFHIYTRLRGVVEHGMAPDVEDPLRQSRSTGLPLWARLTFSPCRSELHLEHHLLMRAPFYRLPELQRLLRARGVYGRSWFEESPMVALRMVASPGRAPPPPLRWPEWRGAQVAEEQPPEWSGRTGWLARAGEAVVRFGARWREADALRRVMAE
jgi:fatty acid desaturase